LTANDPVASAPDASRNQAVKALLAAARHGDLPGVIRLLDSKLPRKCAER